MLTKVSAVSQETLTKTLLSKKAPELSVFKGEMCMAVNRKAALVLLLVSLIAPCILKIQLGKAGPKTITVPDDYPTITAAIDNATEGDTIFVKKGTYEEKTLEINKTLSLIGEDAESTRINLDPLLRTVVVDVLGHTASFLDSSITVEANDFRLSGFTINLNNTNFSGGSISIVGNGTRITDNKITTEMYVHGSYVNILENTFSNAVNVNGSYCKISANDGGFSLRLAGSYCSISANSITGTNVEGSFCLVNSNNATNAPYSAFRISGNDNIVYKNLIDHLEVGLAVSGSNNTIVSNRITNCGEGLRPGAGNIYFANYIANNLWGIYIEGVVLNPLGNLSTIYNNNFIGNTYQITTFHEEHEIDYFDNGKEGNYWSDYNGTDADGDGIGDTPYVIDDNRQDRYPLMAPFDISSVTVEPPEWASSPTPTPTPIDTQSLPTTLLVAVAIIACVFGFGLIINIVTGKRKSSNRQSSQEA